MTYLQTVKATASVRDHGEDRVAVFDSGERAVIVVADGAGGVGGGEVAAETVVREVGRGFEQVHSADEWGALLKQIDLRIGFGESTAAVVDVRRYGIAGGSVGDSRAWIISDAAITDLTNIKVGSLCSAAGRRRPHRSPTLHWMACCSWQPTDSSTTSNRIRFRTWCDSPTSTTFPRPVSI